VRDVIKWRKLTPSTWEGEHRERDRERERERESLDCKNTPSSLWNHPLALDPARHVHSTTAGFKCSLNFKVISLTCYESSSRSAASQRVSQWESESAREWESERVSPSLRAELSNTHTHTHTQTFVPPASEMSRRRCLQGRQWSSFQPCFESTEARLHA